MKAYEANGRASTIPPRLLDLHQAAAYLSVSYWSVRDYVLAGLIPAVQMPALRPREGDRPRNTLRRVLVDRADLDAFIDRAKRPRTRDIQSCAREIEPGKTAPKRSAVPGVCPR